MEYRELEQLATKCLIETKSYLDNLGDRGLELFKKNQFNETALLGDVTCERVIIDTFKRSRVPIRIISEEHGTLDLSPNPVYLGIIDGLDGTSEYKLSRTNGRYATLLGIYSNLNPKYEDCLFSGTMLHSENALYIGNEEGACSIDLSTGIKTNLHSSNNTELKNISLLYHSANHNEIAKKVVGDLPEKYPSKLVTSIGVAYIDIASGNADAVVEVTRKGNLEQMALYRLLKMSGSSMISIEGDNLDLKDCLTYGQDKNLPLITGSSITLAKALRDQVVVNIQ